jgi:hypothetical protein
VPANQADLVRAVLAKNPVGSTPMGPAVRGVLTQLRAHLAANPGRKVALVLVGDGLPGGCAMNDIPSSRPDFAVLAYPVIVMEGKATDRASRRALLGLEPAPSVVERTSTERQVTPRTPPTFLFHTSDDGVVAAENSVQFYLALRRS